MSRLVTTLLATWLLAVSNLAMAVDESTFPDIQRILEAGTLRVAMTTGDIPPLIMTDKDGNITGSEADLARDLARKMGVGIEFVRSADTYDGVVEVVARGEADVGISFLSSDVRRAKRVYFSLPHLKQKRRVFFNRAAMARLQRDFALETIRQLAGSGALSDLQVGVVKGTIYGPLLQRDYPKLAVQPYASVAELVNAVKNGGIFAGFHGELQISYYMQQHPETAIYIGLDPEASYPSDISIAVRPDAPNLLGWVNVYLANHVGQLNPSELIKRYAESPSAGE